MGPGSDAAAERVARLFGLTYPIYGDRRASVFGVFGFKRVLAVVQQSGAVVVGRDGVVRYSHRTGNFLDALHLDEIMRAVDANGADGNSRAG